MSTDTDSLTDEQIQHELLAPAYKFKGVELWPWSRSAKHLWLMICCSPNDTTIFQVLAMMWILRKRKVTDIIAGAVIERPANDASEDLRRNVIPSVYGDLNLVRGEIIFWRDKLSDADEVEAMELFEKILKLEKATETQVSNPDGTQKKMTPIAPPTGDSTSISSEASTAGARKKRSLKPPSPSKIS